MLRLLPCCHGEVLLFPATHAWCTVHHLLRYTAQVPCDDIHTVSVHTQVTEEYDRDMPQR